MTPSRTMLVLVGVVALVVTASPARAQHWGRPSGSSSGSPSAMGSARHGSPPQSRAASGGSWSGTASKWGGSPIRQPDAPCARYGYGIAANAYIPAAVAAVAALPVDVVTDTVYAPYSAAPEGPVQMQVVKPARAPAQLTTMDVYRQQRFAKP